MLDSSRLATVFASYEEPSPESLGEAVETLIDRPGVALDLANLLERAGQISPPTYETLQPSHRLTQRRVTFNFKNLANQRRLPAVADRAPRWPSVSGGGIGLGNSEQTADVLALANAFARLADPRVPMTAFTYSSPHVGRKETGDRKSPLIGLSAEDAVDKWALDNNLIPSGSAVKVENNVRVYAALLWTGDGNIKYEMVGRGRFDQEARDNAHFSLLHHVGAIQQLPELKQPDLGRDI